jgi:hypothetical protein
MKNPIEVYFEFKKITIYFGSLWRMYFSSIDSIRLLREEKETEQYLKFPCPKNNNVMRVIKTKQKLNSSSEGPIVSLSKTRHGRRADDAGRRSNWK